MRENLSLGFENYKSKESIILTLSTSEISIFQLVSVSKHSSLNLNLPETPKTDFLAPRPYFEPVVYIKAAYSVTLNIFRKFLFSF